MHTAMKIERAVFACIVLVGCSFVAMHTLADKQIFKTIDADGNVVFSDVPPAPQQSGEQVELPAPNVFPAATEPGKSADGRELWIVDEDSEDTDAAAAQQYVSLTIRAPANDANIRENTGTFSVLANLDPPLHPGHSLRLLLDDAPADTAGRDATFTLTNVDRGTHTLRAEVVDDDSGEVIFAGEPSVFHLQRYSVLTAPNRPRPN